MTTDQGQRRCDSLVAIPFPPLWLLARSLLSDQKAPRQGRSGNGSNYHHRATTATIRGTDTNQGKGVRIDRSNRHHRAATATIGGTQGNQQGKGRSGNGSNRHHRSTRQRQQSEERKASRQGRCTNGSNRHRRATRARALRFPCCDSFPPVAALGSFPL